MARPDLMEKPPAVIPRVLYRERATLYAAREKLGKTTFVTAAIATVSRGVQLLDGPTRRAPVLWLTEEHLGNPTRRLVAMGADPEWVHIGMLPFAGSPEERVEPIAATVRDRDFTVLVIDTLSVLMRGSGRAGTPTMQAASCDTVAALLVRQLGAVEEGELTVIKTMRASSRFGMPARAGEHTYSPYSVPSVLRSASISSAIERV
jgi:hypothetical protein